MVPTCSLLRFMKSAQYISVSLARLRKSPEREIYFLAVAMPQWKKRQLRHMCCLLCKTKTKQVKCSFCFAVCPFHLFAFKQNSRTSHHLHWYALALVLSLSLSLAPLLHVFHDIFSGIALSHSKTYKNNETGLSLH